MRLLPRETTLNPIVVRMNGGKPYPTGYYDTHIDRNLCCNKDPSLFTETRVKTFLKEAAYVFKCDECGRTGGEGITPNAAAASWNENHKL